MASLSAPVNLTEGARTARPPFIAGLRRWLGLAPFLVFAIAFMIVPASSLLIGSLQDPSGAFTLANIGKLFRPSILRAYLLTIEVSLTTAVAGGIFGFLIAYAVTIGGLPRWVRGVV
ncbi:MAG TPA: acriflavin resistance protein, partial [Spirochaetia bacterium]